MSVGASYSGSKDVDPKGHPGGTKASEVLYDRMTGYGFARRFVEGRVVADIIGREGTGYGSRLLARSAASVTGLTPSTEHAELASTAYPAPNAEYRKVDLGELPYPDDHFDVVVALGALDDVEHPESVVKEARRVLGENGVLVVSARDKMSFVESPEGMYVPEFQEMLERHFGRVSLYGLGAVAGGFVSPLPGPEAVSGVPVEGASLSLTDPRIGAGLPTTRSVLAVCGRGLPAAGSLGQEEPYLMLDRDRRLLDEAEDRAEDMELLREEVRRMQETEVQAFQSSLRLHSSEIAYLRAQVRRSVADARRSAADARRSAADERHARKLLREMENSTTWRIFEPYRRVRARIDAARKRAPGEEGD